MGARSGLLGLVAMAACAGPGAEVAVSEPPPLLRMPRPDRVLVMPLQAEAGLASAGRALDELILEAIHGLGKYQVIGPSDLSALLGVEAARDAFGCDDVVCAAELGGALGAPTLVAGQLRELPGEAVLSFRLMDTTVPAVLERAAVRGEARAESLARMVDVAIAELFHTIDRIELERTSRCESRIGGAREPRIEYSLDDRFVERSLLRRTPLGHLGGELHRGDRHFRDVGGVVDTEPQTRLQKLERVVAERLDEVQSCYERELRDDPQLGGRMVVEWVVRPNGRVTAPRIKSAHAELRSVSTCVVDAIRSWRFPRQDSPVTVVYPFAFESVAF